MTRPYRFLSTTTIVNPSSSLDQTAAQSPAESIAMESDFVVILAALLCALICVLGLIAVARCAWLRRSSTPTTTTTRRNHTQPAANKGMKKKVVESLPKFIYNSTNEQKGVENCWKILSGECAICLAEYSDGDEVRVLPLCGHNFHVACIDMWLSSHSSCPSCRQTLVMTRCRKCGELPTGFVGESSSEMERKGRLHDNSSCSSDYLP